MRKKLFINGTWIEGEQYAIGEMTEIKLVVFNRN